MKPYIALPVLMLALLLSACSGSVGSADSAAEDKVQVVTTFYPLYDFVQKIGGEHVHAVNLVPAGVEPHDWTPKPRDMRDIGRADLFVYNGAGFEGWVEDALDSLGSGKPYVVEATHGVDLIRLDERESHTEAMHDERDGHAETEHADEDHTEADLDEQENHFEADHTEADHAETEHDGHSHNHGGYDPHAWLSPRQAIVMARNIKDGLIAVDPGHQEDYEAGFRSLEERLTQLDRQFAEMIAAAPKKQFVVSHDAFGYIARDYGLIQRSVMGLTPEAEPTMQEMKEIAEFAAEHDIRYILFEELVSPRLAETLADSLGIGTLTLNPLEGLTEQQMEDGEDYFSIMADNLTTLEKALQ